MDAEELLDRQGGMARRRQLREAGMSRRQLAAAVASGRLRLLTPDLYVTEQRRPDELLRGAVFRLDAVISHHSAALLWGIELAVTPARPHVTVGRDRSRAAHAGVEVHRGHLTANDRVDDMTSVVRTLFDLCRSVPLPEAVVAVDSALRQQLVTADELAESVRALPAGRGRQRVARVVALSDPRAGSVLESLCRVVLAEAGLPRPVTQHLVFAHGRRIGRVDFAWPEQRVVVETDGFAFHSDRSSYRRDRRRGNALQLDGWVVLRFSWEDVVHEPDYVVRSVAAVLVGRAAA